MRCRRDSKHPTRHCQRKAAGRGKPVAPSTVPECVPPVTIRHGPVPENLPNASSAGPTWQIAGKQFLLRIPEIARFLDKFSKA
jgi:hypothetical protein